MRLETWTRGSWIFVQNFVVFFCNAVVYSCYESCFYQCKVHCKIKRQWVQFQKPSVCIRQLSSLSTEDPEDAELTYTMRDLTPRARHTFPSRERHVTDMDPDGRTRPLTPGTPTFMRRAGRNLQGSEPDLLHRCHFSSTTSLESPLSPSRSKSPWSRTDPYDSPEVMREIFKRDYSFQHGLRRGLRHLVVCNYSLELF